jgi:hypothetical protein
MNHVNSLSLVEFTFDVEKGLIHGLALAHFVDEPAVLLVFAKLFEHADVFDA